ncbi:hypothetical protein B0H34DRAFT_798479 [Crassisporium funariophilum]|nr:hypothetical protein B0H34DRAFT_798479 [Crassisporium funariophilum]
MQFSRSIITGGSFVSHYSGVCRSGFDILHQKISPGAFHDSGERFEPPKCHPNTRKAVIRIIMDWIQSAFVSFPIIWVHGPAGAGKSAIAQTIAELCHTLGLLLGSFFFSRIADGRNNEKCLIPTIAYQVALYIPATRSHIERAVANDPSVFDKSLEAQARVLIVEPLQLAYQMHACSSAEQPVWPTLLIIDGLDECFDTKTQTIILQVLCDIAQKLNSVHVHTLIACRPEHHLRTAFNTGRLNLLSRRLHLDYSFHPDADIELFLRDKFAAIRENHPFDSDIPKDWPSHDNISLLVAKSSGQFIFASTVVRYVESIHGPPVERLKIVCGLSSPPNELEAPFVELDKLYHHILSSVSNISTVLRLLGMKLVEATSTTSIVNAINPIDCGEPWSIGQFLWLQDDDLRYSLANLDSVLVKIVDDGWDVQLLHASLPDFFTDRSRSGRFYIDIEKVHADVAICYIKHFSRLERQNQRSANLWYHLSDHLKLAFPTEELRRELLSFDVMKVVWKRRYFHWESGLSCVPHFLASIQSSKYSDRNLIHQEIRRKIDQYFEAGLSHYRQVDAVLDDGFTFHDLKVLVAANARFLTIDDSDNMTIGVGFYHPFWINLTEHLASAGSFAVDKDCLDLVGALSDVSFDHCRRLLHEFLQEPGRAKGFYVTGDMFAGMALRCLRSTVEHMPGYAAIPIA